MRGSAAFRASATPGGVLAGPWTRNELWRRARAVPSLDLRFADNKSLTDATTGQNLVAFTRASSGTYVDSQGVIRTAVTNEARFDHNPTTGESLGLLVEEQRTNSIRNNTMVGAVAGTPGTAPTNWTLAQNGITGVSFSVIGTGTLNGIAYIDIRAVGTPSATVGQAIQIAFEGSNTVSASPSQAWTNSAWVQIVGGSATNITEFTLNTQQYNAGVFVRENTVAFTPSTSSFSRYAGAVTFSAATTTAARPLLAFGTTASAAIDITLRVGLPQLEQGAFATSVIPTTTAAATRAADVASITGSNFSSWYRQDEGTVFVEWFGGPVATFKFPAVAAARQASANNSQNTIEIFQGPSLTNIRANGLVRVLNVDQISRDSGDLTLVGTKVKAALGVRTNNFVFTANGLQVGAVDTLGTLPTVDTFNIGFNSASEQLNGHIRRLTYWPQRLPNATLQQITQ